MKQTLIAPLIVSFACLTPAQDQGASDTTAKPVSGAGKAPVPNPDPRAHEGVWKPIAAVLGGVRIPEETVKAITLKVTDGKYEVTIEGKEES